MILHVTFSDGSNPWIFYGDRQQVAKHWKRWIKYHPDTAQPVTHNGNYICKPFPGDPGFLVWRRDSFRATVHYYKHLGHALRALERLGGGER